MGKTLIALMWAGLLLIAASLLDAVVTVWVFKRYGGCPMIKKQDK